MDFDFDVIVIGGGAAGGTLAAEVARAGSNVLLLERGRQADTPQNHDERATLIDKQPYDDRTVHVNDSPSRLYIGTGPGGGTNVYGGALLRPAEDDFHPGRHYGSRLPKHLWDWPISYDDLAPFYNKAERLLNVAADPADDFSPLNPTLGTPSNPPLELARINKTFIDRARQAKLNPFRLPLGIESSRCLKCSHCAGFLCPTGARTSTRDLLWPSLQSRGKVTVLDDSEVTRLERTDNQVSGVAVRNRTTDEVETFKARRYVLAAGAIGSPVILQRSGFEHPQLGRNYMMHYSPLAVGFFLRSTEADRTFVKQLGFADFYFGTEELPEKMGILQSLPAPGPLMLQKTGLKYVPSFVLIRLRGHMLPMVGIVEDLPNADNYVEWKNDRISLRHEFSDFDRQRGAALTKAMKRVLRAAGAVHCVTKAMPSREHVAHQCGTIRFGNDPKHAIVDRDCRMFGYENLFVADGSILPTSLGVGPSLTLVANALRVADIITKEL